MEDLLLKEIKFYQVGKKGDMFDKKKSAPIKKKFPPLEDKYKHTRNNGK